MPYSFTKEIFDLFTPIGGLTGYHQKIIFILITLKIELLCFKQLDKVLLDRNNYELIKKNCPSMISI